MSDTSRGLGFRRAAESAFAFLRTEFGFRLAAADDTFMRYEDETVFVNVYHGRSSYVVSFEVGRLASPTVQYSAEEVTALNGSNEPSFFQASTPERVSIYVPRLADLLRRNGRRLLTGDDAEFSRLDEVRHRLSKALTRRYELLALREKAERAWKRRDYAAVIEVLNAIDDDMSESERWKLQYAVRKLGGVH